VLKPASGVKVNHAQKKKIKKKILGLWYKMGACKGAVVGTGGKCKISGKIRVGKK